MKVKWVNYWIMSRDDIAKRVQKAGYKLVGGRILNQTYILRRRGKKSLALYILQGPLNYWRNQEVYDLYKIELER